MGLYLSIDLKKLTTETRNPNTKNLDQMTSLEIITEMNKEDQKVSEAVKKELPQISKAVDWAVEALSSGGRIIYMGAGTSGRLGVLDAVECPPTFGVSPDLVVGLIAGGDKAFVKAVEGAEDDPELAKAELKNIGLNKVDFVIGLAASGRTPYVLGAFDYANEIGCHTAAISCNKGSAIGNKAQLAIEVVVGPEVLTGSTRLKAGTAQKLVLNMISTASMVGVGKAYENLMVDVMQTNEKLHVRAENIVMEATGVSREKAKEVITISNGSVKTAITMILGGLSLEQAQISLEKANGHVRAAIKK